jgi:hypothetical protein
MLLACDVKRIAALHGVALQTFITGDLSAPNPLRILCFAMLVVGWLQHLLCLLWRPASEFVAFGGLQSDNTGHA